MRAYIYATWRGFRARISGFVSIYSFRDDTRRSTNRYPKNPSGVLNVSFKLMSPDATVEARISQRGRDTRFSVTICVNPYAFTDKLAKF